MARRAQGGHYGAAMDVRLDGKVAVVTGASRGIGLAAARAMLQAGASVLVTARHADDLAEAVAGLEEVGRGRVAWHAANAGSPDDARAAVGEAVDRFGGIDVLVNNAATNPYYGPLMGMDPPRAAKTVEVNQTGVLLWTQAAWHGGMAERGGAVVNVASIGGLAAELGLGWYGVTKAAVIHLTRQLAAELGPTVRVNAVAPGLVRTRFATVLVEDHGDAVAARLPLRRLGTPEDVAAAVLFLASDAASWITGETLVVDGGAMVAPTGRV